MSTLLVIDPGITATIRDGGWLPDLGLIKDWANKQYGPVTKSCAYVTYQPRSNVGTDRDDMSDEGRDKFTRYLTSVGYTDVSTIQSTASGSNGAIKCNADTSIMRDIWGSLVREETEFSPLTGYTTQPRKGEYDTLVAVMGDWDIIRPLLVQERVTGSMPTLIQLGINVIVLYKEACTKKEILKLSEEGVITFISLENHKNELTRNREKVLC